MENAIHLAAQSRRYRVWGWVICLASAIFFSSKAIAIKLAYQHGVDAASLLALRMGVALPIYLFLALYYWHTAGVKQRVETVKALPKVVAVGILGYFLASLFDFMGLAYISAQLERVVLFSYPILVVFVGVVLFRQALNRSVLVAIPFCWLGIVISMVGDWQGAGDQVGVGTALVFMSAACYAVYTVMAKGLIQRLGGGLFTSIAMASAALASLIHALWSTGLTGLLQWSEPVYGYALYMALFATVIPSYLYSEAVKRLGSDLAATSSSIGPVATSVMAVAILGEPFGMWQALGLSLVLASVLWLSRKA